MLYTHIIVIYNIGERGIKMEIRVLRYFLAVAREGSITAAANYLHLTQPTLSRQIHDLEDELGQQLLIRGSHRVSLTQQGVLSESVQRR